MTLLKKEKAENVLMRRSCRYELWEHIMLILYLVINYSFNSSLVCGMSPAKIYKWNFMIGFLSKPKNLAVIDMIAPFSSSFVRWNSNHRNLIVSICYNYILRLIHRSRWNSVRLPDFSSCGCMQYWEISPILW